MIAYNRKAIDGPTLTFECRLLNADCLGGTDGRDHPRKHPFKTGKLRCTHRFLTSKMYKNDPISVAARVNIFKNGVHIIHFWKENISGINISFDQILFSILFKIMAKNVKPVRFKKINFTFSHAF